MVLSEGGRRFFYICKTARSRKDRAVGTLWFVAAGIFEKIFPCFGLMKAKTREKIFNLDSVFYLCLHLYIKFFRQFF